MNMDELVSRQQYIKNQNDFKKKANVKDYVIANRKKVDLDKRLEELSITNNTLVSGAIVRQNILNSTPSVATTPSTVVDAEIYLENETNEKNKQNNYDNLSYNVNRGKEVIQNMRTNKTSSFPKKGNNKFNGNI